MSRVNFDTVVGNMREPLIWYHFDEASGSVVNYGSVGNVADAPVTGGNYQVDGLLGTAEALELSGTTDVVTIPYDASWANENVFTAVFIAKIYRDDSMFAPVLMGLHTGPILQMRLRDGANPSLEPFMTAGVRELDPTLDYKTDAHVTTHDLPEDGEFAFFTFSYDDKNDRRPRITLNGNEVTYFDEIVYDNTTGKALPSYLTGQQVFQAWYAGLTLGNNHTGGRGTKVALDEYLLFDFVLSNEELEAINNSLS